VRAGALLPIGYQYPAASSESIAASLFHFRCYVKCLLRHRSFVPEQSPFDTLAVIIMINKQSTVVTMLFVGAKFVSENNDDEIPQKSV
jgi:hypothetical protein